MRCGRVKHGEAETGARQQGQRVGVRGAERAMLNMQRLLLGRIGVGLEQLGAGGAAHLRPRFGVRRRHGLGNRRRERRKQHRETCYPGYKATSD